MKQSNRSTVGRRKFLYVLGVGMGLAAMAVSSAGEAKANADTRDYERKPRYNPDSKDVKTYYRVNEY